MFHKISTLGNETWLNNRGAVLMETVVIVSLFAILIIGAAVNFWVTDAHMNHRVLATEMSMATQLPALDFDSNTSSFRSLCFGSGCSDPNLTTPTLDEFLDTFGNFFLSRASSSTSLHVRLGYLLVHGIDNPADPSDVTGVATSFDPSAPIKTYGAKATGPCDQTAIQQEFDGFSQAFLQKMKDYTPSGATSSPKVGIKLFKVRLNGTDYEEYIDRLPVVFFYFCDQPISSLYPQPARTILPLIPTKLIT